MLMILIAIAMLATNDRAKNEKARSDSKAIKVYKKTWKRKKNSYVLVNEREERRSKKTRMNREMKKDPRSITFDTLVNISNIEIHKRKLDKYWSHDLNCCFL